MSTGKRIDPYRTFNFRVDIDGTEVASFSEVSGLSAHGDPVEYREGTDPNTPRKLTGLRKYDNINLKRGYTHDDTFWQWYERIANGEDDRRNGSIILLNEKGETVLSWDFVNAWINKVEGPSMNATGNEVGVESVELCHEGVKMVVARQ